MRISRFYLFFMVRPSPKQSLFNRWDSLLGPAPSPIICGSFSFLFFLRRPPGSSSASVSPRAAPFAVGSPSQPAAAKPRETPPPQKMYQPRGRNSALEPEPDAAPLVEAEGLDGGYVPTIAQPSHNNPLVPPTVPYLASSYHPRTLPRTIHRTTPSYHPYHPPYHPYHPYLVVQPPRTTPS